MKMLADSWVFILFDANALIRGRQKGRDFLRMQKSRRFWLSAGFTC